MKHLAICLIYALILTPACKTPETDSTAKSDDVFLLSQNTGYQALKQESPEVAEQIDLAIFDIDEKLQQQYLHIVAVDRNEPNRARYLDQTALSKIDLNNYKLFYARSPDAKYFINVEFSWNNRSKEAQFVMAAYQFDRERMKMTKKFGKVLSQNTKGLSEEELQAWITTQGEDVKSFLSQFNLIATQSKEQRLNQWLVVAALAAFTVSFFGGAALALSRAGAVQPMTGIEKTAMLAIGVAGLAVLVFFVYTLMPKEQRSLDLKGLREAFAK